MFEEPTVDGLVSAPAASTHWSVNAPESSIRAEIAATLDTFFELCGGSPDPHRTGSGRPAAPAKSVSRRAPTIRAHQSASSSRQRTAPAARQTRS